MTSILRDSLFFRLWLATSFSAFGSSITFIALPIMGTVILNAGPAEMGVLAALGTAPFLILGPFVGVFADRFKRKNIMIIADVFRACVLAIIPACYFSDMLSMEVLYITALGVGIGDVWFDIAHGSYLPSVVDKDKLVDAHSKLEVSYSSADIAGPGVAGGLIQVFSAPIAIIIDSATYLLSALLLLTIRKKEPQTEHENSGDAAAPSILSDMKEGFVFIFKHKLLRRLCIRLGVWQFVLGGIFAMLVLYIVNILQFTAVQVGFFFTVMGAGVFLGSLISPKVSASFGVGPTIIFSNLLAPIAGGLLLLASDNGLASMVLVSIAFFITGLTSINYQINNASLRQVITPNKMLGRMGATTRAFTLGLNAIGALLAGFAAEIFTLQMVMSALVALGAVLAFVGLFSSELMAQKAMPEGPEEDRGPEPAQ
ncbi:hypothetical protein JL49_16505 [Pseudoalteromonas luteoviolacea]|nr:hypothetical protein JL49_16505 [Pseudoalteromonas luteoviolacea]